MVCFEDFGGVVGFVRDDDSSTTGSAHHTYELVIDGCEAIILDDEDDDVRALHLGLDTTTDITEDDFVRADIDSATIDEEVGYISLSIVHGILDGIARGVRFLGDDGDTMACEGIKKTGLADIRTTNNEDSW